MRSYRNSHSYYYVVRFTTPNPFSWQILRTLNGKIVEGHYESTIYEKLRNVGKPTIQNGITVSRLRIPCVDRQHRGRYKCIASTGKQTLEKVARITVGEFHLQSTPGMDLN